MMLLGAFVLLLFGFGGMYGSYWLWHMAGLNPNGDAAFMAVMSIFPFMCIPYIIFIWAIGMGCQGLFLCVKARWTGKPI